MMSGVTSVTLVQTVVRVNKLKFGVQLEERRGDDKMNIKTTTLKVGDDISIQGITGKFIGLTTEDGLSNINQCNGVTIYKGFLDNKYFELEEVNEYGGVYDLLRGDEDYFEKIISFVKNTDAIKKWYAWYENV